MNRIAVQTAGPDAYLGLPETYRKIREWGFDAADAGLDHLLPYADIRAGKIPDILVRGGKDCMELFRPWADGASAAGVDNYQAHAPFPSLISPLDCDTNTRMIAVLENMIRGCDLIGCRNLIIHPFYYGYDIRLTPGEEFEINLEQYSKLIPLARQYGVTLCLENMFTRHAGKIYAACCSDIGEACRMVDELNRAAGSRIFGFCLDTGHMLLCGLDAYDTVTRLGSRISTFHIHDNNGLDDQHLAPYMGVLDWDRFCAGVKAIGYDGTLSFETFNVWNQVNPEVCGEMMRFIAACGQMFARKIAR